MGRKWRLCVALTLALALSVLGADVTVSGFSVYSIRTAVLTAAPGDTVHVPSGTYTGCFMNSTIVLPAALENTTLGLTITGPPAGQGRAVIDCGANGDTQSARIMDFRPADVRRFACSSQQGATNQDNLCQFCGPAGRFQIDITPVFLGGRADWIVVANLNFNAFSYAHDDEEDPDFVADNAMLIYASAKTRIVNCTMSNGDIQGPHRMMRTRANHSVYEEYYYSGSSYHSKPIDDFERISDFLISGGLVSSPLFASLELIGCSFFNIRMRSSWFVTTTALGREFCNDFNVDEPACLGPIPDRTVQPLFGALIGSAGFATFTMRDCTMSDNHGVALVVLSQWPQFTAFNMFKKWGDYYMQIACPSGVNLLSALFPSGYPPTMSGQSEAVVDNCVFANNTGTALYAWGIMLSVLNTNFSGLPPEPVHTPADYQTWSQASAIAVVNRTILLGDTVPNSQPNYFLRFVEFPSTVVIDNCVFAGSNYCSASSTSSSSLSTSGSTVGSTSSTEPTCSAGYVIEISSGGNTVSITNSLFVANTVSSYSLGQANATLPVFPYPNLVSTGVINCMGTYDCPATLNVMNTTFYGNSVEGLNETDNVGLITTTYCNLDATGSQFVDNQFSGTGGVLACRVGNNGQILRFDPGPQASGNSGLDFDAMGLVSHCDDTCHCVAEDLIYYYAAEYNLTPLDCIGVVGAKCAYTCNNATDVVLYSVFSIIDQTIITPDEGAFSFPMCGPRPCPTIGSIQNGLLDNERDIAVGDSVTITCDTGYFLLGAGTLTCLYGSVYDNPLPTCNVSRCPLLEAPQHGTINTTGNAISDTATYNCDDGYALSGSSQIYCTVDGSWSDNTTCEITVCSANPQIYAGTCIGAPPRAVSDDTCAVGCRAGTAGLAVFDQTCLQPITNAAGVFRVPLSNCVVCPVDTYATALSTNCTACPNGYTTATNTTSKTECLCLPKFAEKTPGEGDCELCLDGAFCPGDKAQPVAAPGFMYSKGAYVACRPVQACLGNNTCADGYTDYLCGICADGYYQLNGICSKCPAQNKWQAAVGAIGGAIICLALIGTVQPISFKPPIRFVTPTIALSFMQVISEFVQIAFPWSINLRDFFAFFSFFNINFDLLNLECVSKYTYYDKLVLELVVPLIILGLFLLVGGVLSLVAFIKNRKRGGVLNALKSIAMTFGATYLLLLTIVYMYLTKASVGYFSCFKQADGLYTLSSEPGEQCFTDNWNRYLPLAIFGIIVYVVGIPVLLAVTFVLVRRRYGVDATTSHPLTTFFVAKYKLGTWYFELLVMLRKFAIVFFTLYFVQSVTAQAVANSIVLLVACMLTLFLHPFLWNKHDYIESASLVSCLIVLLGGIVMNSQGVTQAQQQVVSNVIIAVMVLSIILMASFTIIETYVKIKTLLNAKKANSATAAVLEHAEGKGMNSICINHSWLVAGMNDNAIGIYPIKDIKKEKTKPAKIYNTTPGAHVISVDYLDSGHVLVVVNTGQLLAINIHEDKEFALLTHTSPIVASARHRSLVTFADTKGDITVLRLREGGAKAVSSSSSSSKSSSGSDKEDAVPTGTTMEAEVVESWSTGATAPISVLAMTQEYVYSASGAVIHEWHVTDKVNRLKATWTYNTRDVQCLSLHGKLLLSGNKAHEAVLFDITCGTVLQRLQGHPDAVTCAATHGEFVYTGCADGTVRIWSQDGELLQLLEGHEGSVNRLCIQPRAASTGQVDLWTCSADATIRHVEVDYARNMIPEDLQVAAIIRRMRRKKGALDDDTEGSVALRPLVRPTDDSSAAGVLGPAAHDKNADSHNNSHSADDSDMSRDAELDAALAVDLAPGLLRNLSVREKQKLLARA